MVDAATRKAVSNIPQLKTKAGPRDKEEWVKRLKEEYASLISYVKTNKDSDTDWFRLESNKEGTRWFGKCWHIQVFSNRQFSNIVKIKKTHLYQPPYYLMIKFCMQFYFRI